MVPDRDRAQLHALLHAPERGEDVGQVPERLHHRLGPVRGERERDEPEPEDADVRAGGVHVHEHPGDEVVDEGIALGVDLHPVDLGVGGGEVGGLAEVVDDLDPGRALDRDLVQHARPGEERVPDLDLDLLLGDHRPEVAPAGDDVDLGRGRRGPRRDRGTPRTRTRRAAGRPAGRGRSPRTTAAPPRRRRRAGRGSEASLRSTEASRAGRHREPAGRRASRWPSTPPSARRSWGRACSRARRPAGSRRRRSPRRPPRTRTGSGGSRGGPTAPRGR